MRELLFYLLVKGFGLYQVVISVGIHLVNITQTFLLWIRGEELMLEMYKVAIW